MTAGSELDPDDWEEFRALAHEALDGMIDHIRTVRERPVWAPAPPEIRARFAAGLPQKGASLAEALEFSTRRSSLIPPAISIPPSWAGSMAPGRRSAWSRKCSAAGLNANCGGRDHIGVEVERQITRWMRQAFGFPETAAGLFVTGTSIANFLAVLVARLALLGEDVRRSGDAASATGLHVRGCPWLHRPGDGNGGHRLRQSAPRALRS